VSKNLTGDETITLQRLTTYGTARLIRERAGYKAVEFAGLVGIAARTLRSWEEGKATPRQPYTARKYLHELRKASQTIVAEVEQRRRQG